MLPGLAMDKSTEKMINGLMLQNKAANFKISDA